MSFLSCDHCGHRAPGKLLGVYVAQGQLGDYARHKLRLCARHLAFVKENLAQSKCFPLDEALAVSYGSSPECLACGKPVEEVGWQCFITAYPSNDEREDYWTQLHIDCSLPQYLKEVERPAA